MSDLSKTMAAASMGMNAQASRLRISTENIANADTPGYQRKLVPFEQVMADDGTRSVRAGRVYLDRTDLRTIHDPSHPLAGADGTSSIFDKTLFFIQAGSHHSIGLTNVLWIKMLK